MRRRGRPSVWWFLAVLYLAVIYTTLDLMPSVWYALRDLFPCDWLVVQSVVYCIIGAATFAYMAFVKKERSIKKYLAFFLFVAAFLVMFKFEKEIPEKIHMAQYGTLGFLVYNALRAGLGRFDARLYVYGSVICFAAGALDEIIQFFLPKRYFTWHDFFINGASGIMVLLAIRFIILKDESSKRHPR